MNNFNNIKTELDNNNNNNNNNNTIDNCNIFENIEENKNYYPSNKLNNNIESNSKLFNEMDAIENTITKIKKLKSALSGNPIAIVELLDTDHKMSKKLTILKTLPSLMRALGNDNEKNNDVINKKDENTKNINSLNFDNFFNLNEIFNNKESANNFNNNYEKEAKNQINKTSNMDSNKNEDFEQIISFNFKKQLNYRT